MQRVIQTWQARLAAMAIALCVPTMAPAWTLTDQNGVHYSQSDSHGKWVLVNFWAPWCPECRQEMPDLVGLQQRHASLQIIGVAVMYASRDKVKKVEQDAQLNYPVVMGNEDIASDFGSMRGMPTSFLYDPSGKLAARYDGTVPIADVEKRLPAEANGN